MTPDYSIRKKKLRIKDYIEGILKKDKSILGQVITFLESNSETQRNLGIDILKELPSIKNHNSLRIGFTGAPGVGKSTLINYLGNIILKKHNALAILTTDPASTISRGSIMGDKTRMVDLLDQDNIFMRSFSNINNLSSINIRTSEIIFLLESAGYNIIIIETVGIGQSEVEIRHMVDLLLLLLPPENGDELQSIKRGVIEIADIIIIAKSEKDRLKVAQKTKINYENAIRNQNTKHKNWKPKVMLCSAFSRENVEELYVNIIDFFNYIHNNKQFEKQRIQQSINHIEYSVVNKVLHDIHKNMDISKMIKVGTKKVLLKHSNIHTLINRIIQTYKNS